MYNISETSRGDSMNIQNTGNILNAGDPIGKNRETAKGQRSERTEKTIPADLTRKGTPETEDTTQVAARPSSDLFQTTAERDRVRELTETLDHTDAPVREEAIAGARARISEGYYNTREFMGNLATRLVNTDRVI